MLDSMEKLMTQKICVGRIVHYYEPGTPPTQAPMVARAALIIATNKEQPELGDAVALMVFRAYGAAPIHRAKFSEKPKSECWSWPTNE